MTISLLAFALLCMVRSAPAFADWGQAGAQYSCNQQQQSFELLPYDQGSSDPSPSLKPGFVEIKEEHPSISCSLGRHILHADIEVFPPGNGQCMGVGFVRANSVSIEGIELLPDSPAFDFDCPGTSDTLMRFRVVNANGHLSVERCYQSGTSSGRNGCATEHVDIDAVAKQKARELNSLASPDVQERQSAAKLSAENDMANVFRSPESVVGSAPVCAHFKYYFSRLGDSIPGESAVTPIARISGSSDRDRIYIQPADPDICDSNVESQCNLISPDPQP